eukprot:210653-Rhodomonas_salina.2
MIRRGPRNRQRTGTRLLRTRCDHELLAHSGALRVGMFCSTDPGVVGEVSGRPRADRATTSDPSLQ